MMTATNSKADLATTIKQQVLNQMEATLDRVIPEVLGKGGQKLLKNVSVVKTTGKCSAIWQELDRLKAADKEPDLKGVKRIGARKRWNPHTTRIQYYRWKHARDANK